MDLAVRGDQVGVVHRLEHERLHRRHFLAHALIVDVDVHRVDEARVQLGWQQRRRRPRREHEVGADVEVHPRARARPFVHEIVEEARMPAHRDALARGAEVGLGGDRVLVVAEVIAEVCEQLHDDDAEIGGAALLPIGHDLREPIEQDLAKAAVVLGEVIERRRGRDRRLARRRGGAVERRRALGLEREVDRRGDGIPILRGLGCVGLRISDDGERVLGGVAELVGAHDEHVVGRRQRREVGPLLGREIVGVRGVGEVLLIGAIGPQDAQPLAAHTAGEHEVALAVAGAVAVGAERPRLKQLEHERALLRRIDLEREVIEHLEKIDAVDRGVAGRAQLRAPRVRAADELRAHVTPLA